MIEGDRPSECEYCWKVEDSGEENVFSDRIIKSGEDWSAPYLNEVIDAGYIKKEYFLISGIRRPVSSICLFTSKKLF